MATKVQPLNLNTEATAAAEPKTAEPKTAEPVGKPGGKPKKKMAGMVMVLVLLGVASGYGLFKVTQPQAPKKLKTEAEGELQKGDTFGVMDEEAFRDEVEGMMVSGGIDGEGSHHLEREGGESQNVYLTSSIIDLDQFVDHKVKVWGETFAAQKVGWLMDVGKLQVLD